MIHPQMGVWTVEFSDRLGWILLGMALGYIIRLLQDMKREVHEVDEIVTRRERKKASKQRRARDEGGFMSNRYAADIAMVLVFVMCLYATFSTGSTNNKLEEAVKDLSAQQANLKANAKADEQTQLRLARITVCTQDYLSRTIEALNQRTEFTQAQADANVKLQKAQSEFLRVVITQPPLSEAEQEAALELYVSRLQAFVEVAGKNKDSVVGSEYPTPEQLRSCLSTPTQDEKDNPDDKKE